MRGEYSCSPSRERAFGGSEKFGGNLPVSRKDLGMADDDFLSFFPPDAQTHDACKILTEIVYEFAAFRTENGNGTDNLVRADGRAVRSEEFGTEFHLFRRGIMPGDAFRLDGSVIYLSVVKFRKAKIALRCHLPVFVRADHLGAAVFVYDAYFRQKRLSGSRDAIRPRHDERSHSPAARDHSRQYIVPPHRLCNVVRLILQMMFIRSKAGSKIVLAHFFAVERELVYADCGGVYNGGTDTLIARKIPFEGHGNRRSLFFRKTIVSVGDPDSSPRFPSSARRKAERRFRAFPYVILDGESRRIVCKGFERRALISDADLPGSFRLPAVDGKHSAAQRRAPAVAF